MKSPDFHFSPGPANPGANFGALFARFSSQCFSGIIVIICSLLQEETEAQGDWGSRPWVTRQGGRWQSGSRDRLVPLRASLLCLEHLTCTIQPASPKDIGAAQETAIDDWFIDFIPAWEGRLALHVAACISFSNLLSPPPPRRLPGPHLLQSCGVILRSYLLMDRCIQEAPHFLDPRM